MNRNENLIETLRGKVDEFASIANDLKGLTMYKEDGHCETELMCGMLDLLNRCVEASLVVETAIKVTFGIKDEEQPVKKGKRAGKKFSPADILKQCTLGEDKVMRLPNIQLEKGCYLEVKKWIEEAGGSWQGGKVQGFTFPFDPARVFSILHEGKRCNLAQDYQFFETPASLADWLVEKAGGVSEGDTVLEPSAGRGAIVKAILRSCPTARVDCYEMMPENISILKGMDGVNLLGEDFTSLLPNDERMWRKIIANPPFSGNQDIDHVRRMYDRLEQGGTMAAITSRHWVFAEERKCVDFRLWLEEVGAEQIPIEEGTFKESGTGIPTMAIVISKR